MERLMRLLYFLTRWLFGLIQNKKSLAVIARCSNKQNPAILYIIFYHNFIVMNPIKFSACSRPNWYRIPFEYWDSFAGRFIVLKGILLEKKRYQSQKYFRKAIPLTLLSHLFYFISSKKNKFVNSIESDSFLFVTHMISFFLFFMDPKITIKTSILLLSFLLLAMNSITRFGPMSKSTRYKVHFTPK